MDELSVARVRRAMQLGEEAKDHINASIWVMWEGVRRDHPKCEPQLLFSYMLDRLIAEAFEASNEDKVFYLRNALEQMTETEWKQGEPFPTDEELED